MELVQLMISLRACLVQSTQSNNEYIVMMPASIEVGIFSLLTE